MTRLLTPPELAAELRVSVREVQRLASQGRLGAGALRVGRAWRFDRERVFEALRSGSRR